MFPRMTRRFLTVLSALAILSACPSPEDQEAKARIFSPEEPKAEAAAAAEPVDASALARDAVLGHRVLTMSAEEAFRRMGSHRFKGEASFEWRLSDRKIALSETREVAIEAPDRFYVRNENDRDRGHELMRLGRESYVRIKYLPWRQRVREQKPALDDLNNNYGLLKSAVQMLRNRVMLIEDGHDELEGRPAERYTLALSKEPFLPVKPAGLPAPIYPEGGPSPDTQARLDFQMLGTPQSLEGRVWIDAKTGVPLKSELWGSISVLTKEKDALVQLKISHVLSDIGTLAPLKAPEEFLPAEDRPNAIAAALKRFGMETAADAKDSKGEQAASEEDKD